MPRWPRLPAPSQRAVPFQCRSRFFTAFWRLANQSKNAIPDGIVIAVAFGGLLWSGSRATELHRASPSAAQHGTAPHAARHVLQVALPPQRHWAVRATSRSDCEGGRGPVAHMSAACHPRPPQPRLCRVFTFSFKTGGCTPSPHFDGASILNGCHCRSRMHALHTAPYKVGLWTALPHLSQLWFTAAAGACVQGTRGNPDGMALCV